jgi:hypothetical protein
MILYSRQLLLLMLHSIEYVLYRMCSPYSLLVAAADAALYRMCSL